MCKPVARGLLISSALILIMIAFSLKLVRGVLFAQDFKGPREEMVKYQIEARGIKDKSVLAAMRKVERHRFVPWHLRYSAYDDTALPLQSHGSHNL